jgi:hypothetical protein
MKELLTCIKDWEEGNAKTKHTFENKELEDSFSELYLEDEQVAVDTLGSSHASQSQTPADPNPHVDDSSYLARLNFEVWLCACNYTITLNNVIYVRTLNELWAALFFPI